MAKVKSTESKPKMRPALTPESRELQLISLAVDCAEEQLRERTASSQVITHFLKLATEKAQLEKEKLRHETELIKAKTKAQESAEEMKALYEKAIGAMQIYAGQGDPDDY